MLASPSVRPRTRPADAKIAAALQRGHGSDVVSLLWKQTRAGAAELHALHVGLQPRTQEEPSALVARGLDEVHSFSDLVLDPRTFG